MGKLNELRRLRAERGWSQRVLAARAGLNLTTVCDIEAGRVKRPQAATVGKLARALEIPLGDLLEEAS